jgi:glycosyltransferase involved in cell wall biosynthesis
MRAPISGLLPIHNGERWINRNLPTILATLGSVDELVVIDDGSTDSTSEMISSFAQTDSRILLYKSDRKGLVESLNQGLKLANNDWIARYDIDDRYPRERLDVQFKVLDQENIGAVFSDYNIWREGSKFRGRIPSPIYDLQTKLSLFNSQRTAHPSALINRALVLEVGGYLEQEFPAEDLGLWIRLSKISKLRSCERVCLDYNRRIGSISSQKRDLVLKKKATLTTSIKFTKREEELLTDGFDNLLNSYEVNSLKELRRFLFCYDYSTWLNFSSKPSIVARNSSVVQKLRAAKIDALCNPETLKFGAKFLQRKFDAFL